MKDAEERVRHSGIEGFGPEYRKIRAEALEEAAKVIDGKNGLDGTVCARMIRALMEKP
jgi:hypothetical protein